MTMRKPASLARLALVVGVLGCATLSGCVALFLTLEPGVSRKEQVLAKYGTPDEIRQRADGSIVYEYPREPEGRENYRVTLSPDGTLRSVEQLIDEPYFARLQPGMTREQVLEILGRPSAYEAYPRLAETVILWNFTDFGSKRMQFNAHFDERTGLLTHTSRNEDPALQDMGE
jgi:hypothetical protein